MNGSDADINRPASNSHTPGWKTAWTYWAGGRGSLAQRGGKGEDAGDGGPAGREGVITVIPASLENIVTETNIGAKGPPGVPGKGGSGVTRGYDGYDCLKVENWARTSTTYYKGYIMLGRTTLVENKIENPVRGTYRKGGNYHKILGPSRNISEWPAEIGPDGVVTENTLPPIRRHHQSTVKPPLPHTMSIASE